MLDSIFLPLHLPNTTVRYIGYGLPRVRPPPPSIPLRRRTDVRTQVGNLAFANYVDAQPASVTRISNDADPIPVLPPVPLGFHHPRGEVHIRESGEWVSCPGTPPPPVLRFVRIVVSLTHNCLLCSQGRRT